MPIIGRGNSALLPSWVLVFYVPSLDTWRSQLDETEHIGQLQVHGWCGGQGASVFVMISNLELSSRVIIIASDAFLLLTRISCLHKTVATPAGVHGSYYSYCMAILLDIWWLYHLLQTLSLFPALYQTLPAEIHRTRTLRIPCMQLDLQDPCTYHCSESP